MNLAIILALAAVLHVHVSQITHIANATAVAL